MTETARSTAPSAEIDPRWVLGFEISAENRRAIESLVTLSDGRFARQGLPIGRPGVPRPGTFAAGIYDDRDVPSLLELPTHPVLRGPPDQGRRPRVRLDLRRGTLTVDVEVDGDTVTLSQFASITDAGLNVLDVVGPASLIEALDTTSPAPLVDSVSSRRGAIVAARSRTIEPGPVRSRLTEITALAKAPPGDRDDLPRIAEGRRGRVASLRRQSLQTTHEEAWIARWEVAATDLPTEPDLELAIRFAQFHLLQSASNDPETAIGARGLTGSAYRGHVFWDTDVFVVPALAAMAPGLARSALGYRVARIGAATARARTEGRSGARFPWESADRGDEVTPTEGVDLRGRTVPIRTGEQEEHVVADVAWSTVRYLDWTGDEVFRRGSATQILVETARYWQSRVEIDDDGSGHIRGVIGPDEYHEDVDDNAYTNVMAMWNLVRAARHVEVTGQVEPGEHRRWRQTAECLVDGYHPEVGRHEQFQGYFDLEPLLASSLGEPPLSADVLLGASRLAHSQVIKQPDVLMLHHLVPDALPAGSLGSDLDFYLPRTAHGSSLSPAICASLLARAGRPDEARRWFDLAARMDLDDLSRTTAGGVHLATMGGVWQAVNQGFLGVLPSEDGLQIDPRIPLDWGTLTQRFHFRSAVVTLRASHDRLELTSPNPIAMTVGGEPVVARRLAATRRANAWEIR